MATIALKNDKDENITTVQIEDFAIMPEILIWQNKAFKLVNEEEYREVTSHAVPVQAEVKEATK